MLTLATASNSKMSCGDDVSSVITGLMAVSGEEGLSSDDCMLSSSSETLYGRLEEKQTLMRAYARVKETGRSHVVTVHGSSGQGKTSLVVGALRQQVIESNGYFCYGKFFQDSEIQEPYSAIITAFSDLCDLVIQSNDFDSKRRSQIQNDLASDRQMLAGALNLDPLFREDEGCDGGRIVSDFGDNKLASFAGFKAACKAFLRAMTSDKDNSRTLVLFIDDIQWMDYGSERLVDMFVHDKGIGNVLFVFSYRDEEATPAIRDIMLRVPASGSNPIVDIKISNLCDSDVASLVSDHFVEPVSSDLAELNKLLLQRTAGNPFFVRLMLEVIENEKLLSLSQGVWTFDVDKIRKSIMVSDDTAELLSRRIHRLPTDVRDILITASMLGYAFTESILVEVSENTSTEIRGTMPSPASSQGDLPILPANKQQLRLIVQKAVDAGFIEKINDGYQFTHDKLHSAFQGLAAKSTQDGLHLIIGKVYWAQESDESAIYNAAVHLNNVPDFLHSNEQRVELAQINLQAARYCQQMSAFDKAAYLLRRGIDLLSSENKWSHELSCLSFEMITALANVELLVGNFASCEEATSEALLHADSKERLVSTLLIEMECHAAQNEMRVSVKNAMYGLSELGVKMPRKISVRHVIFKFLRINFLMSRKTETEMLELPLAQHGSTPSMAIHLLMKICLYALLLNEEITGTYAALRAMDLTLKHGWSVHSATALAIYGVAVRIITGRVDRAYGLGKVALERMKENQTREADCPTLSVLNTGLLDLKEPLCDLRYPLFEASLAGFNRGDVIFGSVYMTHSFTMALVMGSDFKDLEQSIHDQYYRIHHVGQCCELLVWIRPLRQFVANMRGDDTNWRRLGTMSGEFMDYYEFIEEAQALSWIITVSALTLRALSNFLFGFYDVAAEAFDDWSSMGGATHHTFPHALWSWGAGSSNYELYMDRGKHRYLKKARKIKRNLERCKVAGDPNVSAFLAHLELKEAIVLWRVKRKRKHQQDHDDELLNRCDRDVELIAKQKPFFVEILASVDAGFVAAKMGRHSESVRFFSRAADAALQDWGAIAVSHWIVENMNRVNSSENYQERRAAANPLVGGIVEFGGE